MDFESVYGKIRWILNVNQSQSDLYVFFHKRRIEDKILFNI